MRAARQETKRQRKQTRKARVRQRIRDEARIALESGTPTMFWDDERGVYRSPDMAGNYALDRFGEVKAINLEMENPNVQTFRMMCDNQAIDAMLRWSDQPKYDPEIPF